MHKRLACIVLLFLLPGYAHIHAEPNPTAPVVLIVGDSISSAYGFDVKQGWVALLQNRLRQQAYPHRVINASISGDTSLSARNHFAVTLQRHVPSIVILELGGNDGLRGLPLEDLRRNLAAMIVKTREAGAVPLLLGMRLPPNYGPVFNDRFEAIYANLAEEHNIPWVPFFMQDVVLRDELMQADGIHPNARAQALLLERVWPRLLPLLSNK